MLFSETAQAYFQILQWPLERPQAGKNCNAPFTCHFLKMF